MKYLKLFEYYNEDNFKQVVFDNTSKVLFKEIELELQGLETFDELLKYISQEDHEEYFSFFGEIAKTYKTMFNYYLYRYKGNFINPKDLTAYILKFPLIDTEKGNPEIERKVTEILSIFKNKFDIFNAILGRNDSYTYTSKNGKKYKDGLINDDYCDELAMEEFEPLVCPVYAKIAAKYVAEAIGEDATKYNKLIKGADRAGQPYIYDEIVAETKKLLPSWMTRGKKTGLLDLK